MAAERQASAAPGACAQQAKHHPQKARGANGLAKCGVGRARDRDELATALEHAQGFGQRLAVLAVQLLVLMGGLQPEVSRFIAQPGIAPCLVGIRPGQERVDGNGQPLRQFLAQIELGAFILDFIQRVGVQFHFLVRAVRGSGGHEAQQHRLVDSHRQIIARNRARLDDVGVEPPGGGYLAVGHGHGASTVAGYLVAAIGQGTRTYV